MSKNHAKLASLVAATALLLTACASPGDAGSDGEPAALETLNIDYANYNLPALVIREKGWLEDALAENGTSVNWVFSAGSNRANEALRADAVSIAATGPAPAVQARANGLDIQTFAISNEQFGFGILVNDDSDIRTFDDLRGRSIAATRGTDPYFFILQALEDNGLTTDDVVLENLQHADGRGALSTGAVDAWSGLDPILSNAILDGERLLYADPSLLPGTHINVLTDFAADYPEIVQLVADAYAKAGQWIVANPDEAIELYADAAGIEPEVAAFAFENWNFDVSQTPDVPTLTEQLTRIGAYIVAAGDVASQGEYDDALGSIYVTTFAENADASRIPD